MTAIMVDTVDLTNVTQRAYLYEENLHIADEYDRTGLSWVVEAWEPAEKPSQEVTTL